MWVSRTERFAGGDIVTRVGYGGFACIREQCGVPAVRLPRQSRQLSEPVDRVPSDSGPCQDQPYGGLPRSASRGLSPEITAFCQRLGHRFTRPDLLVQALTHSSVSSATRPSNQRLEFLGDRVLGLVVAEELLAADPDASEGELALRFNSLVRRETCADVARQLELGDALRMGRAEMLSGGRRKDAALADAMEAVIAAVFADAGFFAARSVVLAAWGDRIERSRRDAKDPKTALQEWVQSRGHSRPEYSLVSRDGPDHAPAFTVRVSLESGQAATAQARSKKLAEQNAARDLLRRLTEPRLS